MKWFIFILVCIYVYYLRIRIVKKAIQINIDPDIIISPGGYNGFYQLGICHYIKNHFKFEHKKFLGFSAGSWVSLFMNSDPLIINEILKKIFNKIKYSCDLHKLSNVIKNIIVPDYINKFNITNLNIGVTNIFSKKMIIYNEFVSTEECMRCCIASSFIPYLTYKEPIYFYKNSLVMDGGIFYHQYIKSIDTTKILIITPKLFRPYKYKFGFFKGFIKPKRSLYELYLLGYRNATKNHHILAKYF